MPDDEFMGPEELRALHKEWEQDYALRREENANRRLPSPAGTTPETRPSAQILAFPASVPPRPWPSDLAKAQRQAEPAPPVQEKDTGRDTGHSL